MQKDKEPSTSWSSKTCTHTQEESDPWWEVDLGENMLIYSVVSHSDPNLVISLTIGSIASSAKRLFQIGMELQSTKWHRSLT